jgi:Mg2+-importing ATPase
MRFKDHRIKGIMQNLASLPKSYWSQDAPQLLQALATRADGLTPAEADQRLKDVGLNVLQARSQATPLGLFLNQFKSPIILILLFATLVSGLLKDWPDAIIILVIVLGSALLSFSQEFRASNAVEKLRSQVQVKTNVLRGGQSQSIASEQVVPGDIVQLSAGSLIPADGVVLEARDLFVNQAVLTGETFPVEKQPGTCPASASLPERTNVVFMGTSVRSGEGTAVIVESGTRTAFGQIANRLSLRPPENEFERGIRRLGYLLTEVMFILVFAIFVFNVYFQKPVLDSLLFSIALAVGLTPQLLPAIININLSRGSQSMASAGVIVRRLESIENFGSMDILCTDKTGTLTEGVVHLDEALDPDGESSDVVYRYARWNAGLQTGMKNPLDEAILAKEPSPDAGVSKLDEVPYDFVRKRLSVIVANPQASSAASVDAQQELQQAPALWITKGALEPVLSICSRVRHGDGVLELDDAMRQDLLKKYADWSAQGYRVLGLAIKPDERRDLYSRQDESQMTFAGFLLFFDPPKSGAKVTIEKLSQLGVSLKIITGDNHLVGRHVAAAVGLDGDKTLTGAQIDDLRDEALWHAAQQATLFAEVDPNQKERIILALKKTGHVVGYMGDGINDAPALHSADVGISVDNAVDVAKEAADFVLMRQDLDVLQQGIVEGRKTFANTLKYVFMATSANFGNMFSVAGASLFLPFLPMLPKQILLINFLTDLPELTIASDNVDDFYIANPHQWNIPYIRRFMLVFGSLSSVFDLLTFVVLYWVGHAGQTLFHTGWFVESILSATLVVFALRTRKTAWRSRPARAMVWVTLLVMMIALVLPISPLAGLMGFAALPAHYLGAIVAIVLAYFFSAELAKRWFYRSIRPPVGRRARLAG